MSEAKPPGVSWESWVDRQIVEGTKAGAFDDLGGRGQPIADLDRPHDDDWWIRAKLAREDVAVTPPTIAIRLDRDASLARALAAPDEGAVRSIIGDLNDRIRAVNRSATWGPPSSVAPLDVESVVTRWDSLPRPEPQHAHVDSDADTVHGRSSSAHSVRPRLLAALRSAWRRVVRRRSMR